MDTYTEARSAFILWKRLLELEDLLWTLYNDEFLELIKENPSLRLSKEALDDLMPF